MRLVAFLWVAFALNYMDRQMVFSIFPALSRDLGFTSSQLGLIGSVFGWIYTLSMPVAGKLADRWPQDRMILASLLLWSLATLGCAFSQSTISFLTWRAAMGISESLYYPAAVALLATVNTSQTRSRALGIHQSAQLAGVAMGGWYGGWTADNMGWRNGFSFAAMFGIGYCVVLYFVLRETRKPAAISKAESDIKQGTILSPVYIALCAAFSAFCAMLWIFYAWFPAFLYDRFHLSMTDSGWNATLFVQTSCGAGLVLGTFLADRLSQTIPAARFYIAACGILCSAPFAFLAFHADSLWMVRIFSSAFGAFAGLMIGNVFAAAYDVVPVSLRGLGAGVLNMMGGISSSAMIFAAGVWKESIGFPTMMVGVSSVCGLTAIALVLTVMMRFGKRRDNIGTLAAADSAIR